MVREENEVGLKHRRPYQSYQDPDSCLSYYCRSCPLVSIHSFTIVARVIPVTRFQWKPCSGFCVTSPGLPKSGSSSSRAAFCSGIPVADAIVECCSICCTSWIETQEKKEYAAMQKREQADSTYECRCMSMIYTTCGGECALVAASDHYA